MSVTDDPRTLGPARLAFANEAEIDEFVATLERFERGEITPEAWRAFRLVRGLYGQRQPGDVHMLRVKIPQGVLEAAQLEALADVAERYSRGFGHITTRQNVQFHFVSLADVEAALRRLAAAGLTTREACGNSVRNVTACPYAGVAADELFDVTPYAEAVTRHFLRHPLSASLPRKFKIAFEGCPVDHARTAINDIGWRARVRRVDGRLERGFRVTVAGGTSILPTSGHLLYEFLPATDVLEVAEAIVRVFHRLGDYEHKQRNRLKFLVRALGFARFRDAIEAERAALRSGDGARDWQRSAVPAAVTDISEPPERPRVAPPAVREVAALATSVAPRGPGVQPVVRPLERVDVSLAARWRRTNVRPQRQAGYALVTATVPLGDLTAGQFRVLAALARAYSEGAVRVTPEQNLVFRWVRESEVDALYRRLAAAGLGRPGAGTIADVTSCPGAESCRLAVTRSRGVGRALIEYLDAHPELEAAAPDLDVKISGCPNGCGQHHVAAIGLQGSVRKVGGRAAPQYFILVGGGLDGDAGATFGRLAAKVPVRRVAEALGRLVALYRAEAAPGEAAPAFFRRVPVARVAAALADLAALDPADARAEDFVDLGEETAFAPVVLEGECQA
jgi:sulfite reductase beta subunit-like hemoprotein